MEAMHIIKSHNLVDTIPSDTVTYAELSDNS